jgi:hypothetical protein
MVGSAVLRYGVTLLLPMVLGACQESINLLPRFETAPASGLSDRFRACVSREAVAGLTTSAPSGISPGARRAGPTQVGRLLYRGSAAIVLLILAAMGFNMLITRDTNSGSSAEATGSLSAIAPPK